MAENSPDLEHPFSRVHPPESAGAIMTRRVPVAAPGDAIADIIETISRQAEEYEDLDYVYLVDKNNAFRGLLPIKEVFRRSKTTPASAAMLENVVTVNPETDQERVAYLALEHNLKAVPVVDEAGAFLGAVVSDTLLQTLYNETQEDLLLFAGIEEEAADFPNVMEIPLFQALKHRLPWLLLGLAGGILAAGIVGQFEETLQKHLILAAFIPLLVYMADAVGTQMQAFIIRDLAVNPALQFGRYLWQHLKVLAIIAAIIGVLLFLFSLAMHREVRLGFVLSFSLAVAILSSVITGLFVPYVFQKLDLDPADASGPVATIIQDIMSIIIFFLAASWLL
jgi:magnesium transporter